MVVLRLLLVSITFTWQVYVIGEHLVPLQSPVLQDLPPTMSRELVVKTIGAVSAAKICPGNFEEQFTELALARKGKFLSVCGELVAFLDESFSVNFEGVQYRRTVWHFQCQPLMLYHS